MSKQTKQQVPEWALNKMKKYCAFQERCVMDVRMKLQEFHLQDELNDAVINKLMEEDYLNEERYAKVFASGKFRINKWGRNKIYLALQEKRIPEFYILGGLNEIDEKEYRNQLRNIILKKNQQLKEPDFMKRNKKLANFAISKGYEQSLVWDILNYRD